MPARESRQRFAAFGAVVCAEVALLTAFWVLIDDLQRDWQPVLTALGVVCVAAFGYWTVETVLCGVNGSKRGPVLPLGDLDLSLSELVQIGAIMLALAVLMFVPSDLLAYAVGGSVGAFLVIRGVMTGS